jgi:hypothetical protein
MRKTTRTEIRIETHQVKIIRFQRKSPAVRCDRCDEGVPVLRAESAADLLRMTSAASLIVIEKEGIHLVGTARGIPQICGNSIRPCIEDEGKTQT